MTIPLSELQDTFQLVNAYVTDFHFAYYERFEVLFCLVYPPSYSSGMHFLSFFGLGQQKD
jgi:hypothetical protein